MKTFKGIFTFLIISFLGYWPAYSMEEMVLVVETNEGREIIPTTILKRMEEQLKAKHGSEARINDCFALTYSTPQKAREQFPKSNLFIVTLGAGEAPIDYSDFQRSPSVLYQQEMDKLAEEMRMLGLTLTHRRLQVTLDRSTLASRNIDAFKQAALSLANPMNPQGYPTFKEITDKLISTYKAKAK